jgi:hypothetical protein
MLKGKNSGPVHSRKRIRNIAMDVFICYSGKHYGKAVDWMDATGKEVTLWQHMLERPNFWVEGCLTLRPSLEHRSSS